MKVTLSGVAAVLAAQRRAARPSRARKKSTEQPAAPALVPLPAELPVVAP